MRSGFNPLAATKATAAQLVGLLQEQWGVNTLITCVEGCALQRAQHAASPACSLACRGVVMCALACLPCRQVYEIQTCFNLKLKPIDCPGESKCGRTAQDLPYGGPIPQASCPSCARGWLVGWEVCHCGLWRICHFAALRW